MFASTSFPFSSTTEISTPGIGNVADPGFKGIVSNPGKGVGPIATPEQIYFLSKLPKTRSGKIMRRLLKSLAKK